MRHSVLKLYYVEKESYLFDAKVIDVRPCPMPAVSAGLGLFPVLEVQMLPELDPVVVGEEALHAHQLQRMRLAVLEQGLLVRLVLRDCK